MIRRVLLAIALLAVTTVPAATAQMESVEDQTTEGAGLALVEEPPDEAESEEREEPEPEEEELLAPAPITRITFDVPFPIEKGGGSATGSAGALEYLGEDSIVATGAVEFAYQSVKLQAERVEVDLATRVVVAEGNVILDEGPRRLTGVRLEYELETRTGTIYEAQAFVDPDLFFEGETIEKVADQVYTIRDGMVTSCSEGKTPAWSFRMKRGRVNLEGWAQITSTTMRVKKAPFLYVPYVAFPARRDRRSGFLFPNFGSSSVGGSQLGLAYYQTLGRSYDATLYADLYGEDYFGLGAEFRYAPTHGTNGMASVQFIDDQETEDLTLQGTRWKAFVNHTSEDLPWGLRGVIRYQDFSDFDFFRDFERNFNNISIRTLWSSAFVSGNWGNNSLNVLVDDRETFLSRNRFKTQRQLPEIEYRLRQTRIGRTPLYVEGLSSVSLFQVLFEQDGVNLLDETYARADFAPTFSLPLAPAPWLNVEVRAGGRYTHYQDSLTADGTAFSGETLDRFFPSASAQVIGPSISKIFEKRIGPFAKFKHVIEPRFAYAYTDEFDDQALVPSFDEVDQLRDFEAFSVSVINRVLAKPADEDSLTGAFEILSFELSQSFSLRDDQPFQTSFGDPDLTSKKGPISARLRFGPSTRSSFELRARYNTLFNAIDEASLFGGTQFGAHSVGLSWITRKSAEFDNTNTHQTRLWTAFQLIPTRLRLESQVNVDHVESLLQQQRHALIYTTQCYGFRLEYSEFDDGREVRDEIRLAISLKNIGTFLDLNAGNYNRYN